MIHIRYKSLSPGMHAEAESGLRGIVVYLLPGLTSAQRKAALRRLQQEGSRGCGPRLPLGQLTAALVVDRMRSAVSNTVAVIRQHPIGTLLPALLAGALLAAFVVASASVRMTRTPVSGGPGAASWSVPAGTPGRVGPSARMPSNAAGVGAPSGMLLTGGPAPGEAATGIPPGTEAGTSPVTWAATRAGPAADASAVIVALNTPAASAGHAARQSPAGHDGPSGPSTSSGQGTSPGQDGPVGQAWPAVRGTPGKGGGASTSPQPVSSASPAQSAPAQPAPTRQAQSTATSQPSAAPTGQSASGAGQASSSPVPEPGTQPGG